MGQIWPKALNHQRWNEEVWKAVFLYTQPAWRKQTNVFRTTVFWQKFGRSVATLSCDPSIYCMIINRSRFQLFQIVVLCSYVYMCYIVFQRWVVMDLHYLVWNKDRCCLFWKGIGCFFCSKMSEKYIVPVAELSEMCDNMGFLNWRKAFHLEVIVRKDWLYFKLWEARAGLASLENQLFSTQRSNSANPVLPRLNK